MGDNSLGEDEEFSPRKVRSPGAQGFLFVIKMLVLIVLGLVAPWVIIFVMTGVWQTVRMQFD